MSQDPSSSAWRAEVEPAFASVAVGERDATRGGRCLFSARGESAPVEGDLRSEEG